MSDTEYEAIYPVEDRLEFAARVANVSIYIGKLMDEAAIEIRRLRDIEFMWEGLQK